MNQVVDLTSDSIPIVLPPQVPKFRALPPSITGTTTTNNPQNVASKNYAISGSNVMGVVPRRLPVNFGVVSNGGIAGGSLIGNLYRPPNATVAFSLLNSREFIAKAEYGSISGEVIAMLRFIPGAKFDWAARRWVFPLDAHDILQVAFSQHRHTVEPLPRAIITAAQLKNQRDQAISASGGGEDSLFALLGMVPDKVLHSLAPFQRDAVQFIIRNNGRALLADEMGLGKTRTAISAALAYKDDWPVLIVCPSSARFHWQAELIALLYPDTLEAREITVVETAAHSLTTGVRSFSYKVVIVSYNLVSKLAAQLQTCNFNVVIADECHYLKNRHAKRTQFLVPLIQSVRRAILISGTPALSRPIELFPQLHALAPAQWPDVKEFGRRYCKHTKRKSDGAGGVGAKGKSWSEFGGASNTSELHIMLTGSLMIRRLKKDVLGQLPKKRRVVRRIDIADPALRDEMSAMLDDLRSFEASLRLHGKKKKKVSAYVDDEPAFASIFKPSANDSGGTESTVSSELDANDVGGGAAAEGTAPPIAAPFDDCSPGGLLYDSADENVKRISSRKTAVPNSADMVPTNKLGTSSSSSSKWKQGNGVSGGEAVVQKEAASEDPGELKRQHKNLLMKLFNMSGVAKLPAILQQLGTFLDDKLSGKVLVFAHHRNVLDGVAQYLKARGEEMIRIDGQTSSKDRHARVEHFQTVATCRVAVLAITAAGVAITLTAAANVYFAEMFWTPGSLIQAEDRAHRIGQTSTVTVTYFLADNSVDELLWPLVRKKMKLLGEIVEGQTDVDLTAVTALRDTSSSKQRESSGEKDKTGSGAVRNNWLSDMSATDDSGGAEKASTGQRGNSKRSFSEVAEDSGGEVDGEPGSASLEGLEDLVQEIAQDTKKTARQRSSRQEDDADEEEDEEEAAAEDNVPEDAPEEQVRFEEHDELPDQLALLYMHEYDRVAAMATLTQQHRQEQQRQLQQPPLRHINIANGAMLSKSQAVHHFNGTGHATLLSKDAVPPASSFGPTSSSGDSKGVRRNEVIELDSDPLPSRKAAGSTEIIDLQEDSPPLLAPSYIGNSSSSSGVVKTDFSNMLTGGLGAAHKASVYSAKKHLVIPTTTSSLPHSRSASSLADLGTASDSPSSHVTVTPGWVPSSSSSSSSSSGNKRFQPQKQFVPRNKSMPLLTSVSGDGSNSSSSTPLSVTNLITESGNTAAATNSASSPGLECSFTGSGSTEQSQSSPLQPEDSCRPNASASTELNAVVATGITPTNDGRCRSAGEAPAEGSEIVGGSSLDSPSCSPPHTTVTPALVKAPLPAQASLSGTDPGDLRASLSASSLFAKIKR